MALNIKSEAVERLAAEVAEITGETKTEAIRKALEERKHRLAFQVVRQGRHERLRRFLEREVWPRVPPGMEPMRKDERERILGYGPEGH